MGSWIRIRIRLKCWIRIRLNFWIRIRIQSMRIRNKDFEFYRHRISQTTNIWEPKPHHFPAPCKWIFQSMDSLLPVPRCSVLVNAKYVAGVLSHQLAVNACCILAGGGEGGGYQVHWSSDSGY
jgi:hypothetical protein